MAIRAKKIDVNARDEYGAQPLHKAAFRGNLELVKQLVEAGADVDSLGPGDATPLAFAVGMSHVKVKGANYAGVVAYLIEKDADVNAKNSMGYSILHFAEKKEVIKILKRAGAKKR